MKGKTIVFCALTVWFVFYSSPPAFSDPASKEIGGIYKLYLDSYNWIFSQVDDPTLSIDALRDRVGEFTQTVNSLVQTDEGKGFACLASTHLADIVILEAQVNNHIKPLENESNSQTAKRMYEYVNQIIENQRKELVSVFSAIAIPENSYAKIHYHLFMVALADMGNIGVSFTKEPLIDAREHCDALMNGPVFQENPVILQPPVPVDLIWTPKKITSLQEEIVAGIRQYFLRCKLEEIAKKNEKLGIRWTEEELKNAIANENQYLLDVYPLSKYPFLANY